MAVALILVVACQAQVSVGNGGSGSIVTIGTGTINSVTSILCSFPNYICGSSGKCSSLGIPTWSATDGPATLPNACFNTLIANTPSPSGFYQHGGGNYTAVSASDLTNIFAGTGGFAQIACGQVLQLQAGTSFSGNFTFPALACDSAHWITIETSGIASLPAEGTRISPCYAGVNSLPGRPAFACPGTAGNYMAKLVTSVNTPALSFLSGTSRVRFIGLEITRSSGSGYNALLVKPGNIGANIDHIIFDRNWIHGDEMQDETETGISTSAVSYLAAIDSYFSQFYCVSVSGACVEGHAIFGGINSVTGTTETVQKVVNNYIESASQDVFYGGGLTNTTPSDIEIRLNTLTRPMTWNPSDPSYNGGISGHPFVVKNCFELKNAQRVLFEGNTCSNVWGGFSQTGYALLLTPKVQVTPPSAIPFVSNVTIRYDTVNSAGAFIQLNVVQDSNGNVASGGNWSIHDVVADNILYSTCFGCSSSNVTMGIIEVPSVTNAQHLHDVTVNHVTVVNASAAANPNAFLGLSGAKIATGNQISNVTYTNNLSVAGAHGTFNQIGGGDSTNCAFSQTGGTNMLNACWSPQTFGGNCFINNGTVSWPGTNVTSISSFTAAFLNYNNGNMGNYVLSVNACKGQGLDGLDPGANIAQVASVIAGN